VPTRHHQSVSQSPRVPLLNHESSQSGTWRAGNQSSWRCALGSLTAGRFLMDLFRRSALHQFAASTQHPDSSPAICVFESAEQRRPGIPLGTNEPFFLIIWQSAGKFPMLQTKKVEANKPIRI